MARIVLVGAGSVEFTRNLLGDFLSYPELRDADIVLHDIDADRLTTAMKMAQWTAGALEAVPAITGSLDRREALRGADYVVNTIQVGGARASSRWPRGRPSTAPSCCPSPPLRKRTTRR